jgi:hypothetical protein
MGTSRLPHHAAAVKQVARALKSEHAQAPQEAGTPQKTQCPAAVVDHSVLPRVDPILRKRSPWESAIASSYFAFAWHWTASTFPLLANELLTRSPVLACLMLCLRTDYANAAVACADWHREAVVLPEDGLEREPTTNASLQVARARARIAAASSLRRFIHLLVLRRMVVVAVAGDATPSTARQVAQCLQCRLTKIRREEWMFGIAHFVFRIRRA